MGPKTVEVFAERIESGVVELVQPPCARILVGDQTGAFEYPEVLRDGRAADGEVGGELADGQRAIEEAGEDGAAGGIA